MSEQTRTSPPERPEASTSRKEAIAMAVYAALGCTKIDYRSPRKMYQASEQIADFVEDALDRLMPEWVREYEEYLRDGPAGLRIERPGQ